MGSGPVADVNLAQGRPPLVLWDGCQRQARSGRESNNGSALASAVLGPFSSWQRTWSVRPCRGWVSAISICTLAILSVCGSVAGAQSNLAFSASPPSTWSDLSSIPSAIGGANNVDCVRQTCIAVGGLFEPSIEVSRNSGASWTDAPLPPKLSSLDAISCGSSLVCDSVGVYFQPGPTDTRPGVIIQTHDEGRSWSREELPRVGSLQSISCADVLHCVAVGASGTSVQSTREIAARTSDGGRSWTVQVFHTGNLSLTDISCPIANDCVAVGGVYRGTYTSATEVTFDDGLRWQYETFRAPGTLLGSVTCPSLEVCIATGQRYGHEIDGSPGSVTPIYYTSSDSGRTWVSHNAPPGGAIEDVGCPSLPHCVAVGSKGPLISDDDGSTWTVGSPSATLSQYSISSLTCPSLNSCVAVGGSEGPSNGAYSDPGVFPTFDKSADGGVSWTSVAPPPGWSIASLVCPSTTACVAVGSTSAGIAGVWTSSDLGHSWTASQLPVPAQILNSVVCPSSTDCVAVGNTADGTAIAMASSDGGRSWEDSTLPSGLASLLSVSCSNSHLCVAGGSRVTHITTPPGGHIGIEDIESGSGALLTSANGGRSWTDRTTSATPLGYTPYVLSVSCLPTLFCVTSPNYDAFLSSTDGGVTWMPHTKMSNAPLDNAIACVTASTCVAAASDNPGPPDITWTDDGGTRWTRSHVGTGVVGFSQTEWQITGVECSSNGVCIAVGGDAWYAFRGLAVVSRDAGRTWSAMRLPGGTGTLTAVSCSKLDVCIATTRNQVGKGQILSVDVRVK
jgi:photosystem II stability/assembly factor-like uncharacterized protein